MTILSAIAIALITFGGIGIRLSQPQVRRFLKD